MKRIFTICLFAIAFQSISQNTMKYIPSNAMYIFSINFEQLNKKSGDLNYSKYLVGFNRKRSNYYYGYNSEECDLISIKEIMNHPDSFGLDLHENVFYYQTSVKDISGEVYLFKLKNAELFESKLNTECGNEWDKQKKSLSTGVFYLGKKISVAIQNYIAAIFIKEHTYSYEEYDYSSYNSYQDSLYTAEIQADNFKNDSLLYEQLNKGTYSEYETIVKKTIDNTDSSIVFRAKQREADLKIAKANEKFREILSLMESFVHEQSAHIGNDRNFVKLMDESHDAFLYINAMSAFNNSYLARFGNSYSRKGKTNEVNAGNLKYTSSMSTTYTIDFENGQAKARFFTTYNEHVYPFFKKSFDVRQNKKLLKYIDGDNLLGYMSYAVNAKELAKFYEALYTEVLENVPGIGYEKNILPSIKLAYAFLDKEMLYNTLDGRIIFACTGFTDIKIKFKSYDYDDDFNRTEKIDERIVRQPRMVLACSIGNKENAEKLFKIISQFDVFIKVKENVIAVYANNQMPFNIFITLTEDALVFSNDGASILNNDAKPKLSSEDRKKIMSHNMVFKIYTDKIMAGINDTYFKGADSMPWFAEIMSKMGNLEMSDYKPSKDTYGATAILTLKDASNNALFQLLQMMQRTNGY